MSNLESWNSEVSSLLNNIYRCADKHSWYSQVAEAYNCTRPRYSPEIIAQIQMLPELQPHKSILEIGSGPGIATIDLAKLGVQMVCLEPSLAACELARRKCAEYLQVELINTTFEEWELKNHQFDAVIATTSFHWLTPGIRTQKTAAALKDHGLLILLWNTPPQPTYEVFQEVEDIYQVHTSDLAKYEDHQAHQQHLEKIGQEVIDSGYFKDLISQQVVRQVIYSIDDYITLLSTLSPYIGLTAEKRMTLLTQLKQRLEINYGNQLELSYLSMMQIARKI